MFGAILETALGLSTAHDLVGPVPALLAWVWKPEVAEKKKAAEQHRLQKSEIQKARPSLS